MSPSDEIDTSQYSLEELKAVVYEAQSAGTYVMAHVYSGRSIRNSVAAGIRSLEHGNLLDEEAAQVIKNAGAFLVPTLLAVHRIIQHGEAGGIPEYAVRKAKEVRDRHFANFRRAMEAGVKIAMGTDAGTPYNIHGENLNELPLMVQGGMTPMQAIVATTRMGAELLDMADRIGTLEAGKLADLVVVDGNPLVEIDLFKDPKRVVQVVKDGAVVRSSL